MELFKASKQWATRPADERFWTLQEMLGACSSYKDSAVVAKTKFSRLHCEDKAGEVVVMSSKGVPARLSHWAFGQFSQRVGAPAAYLRGLPAGLAVQNLNHGLNNGGDEDMSFLFHKNGNLLLRACTSLKYKRIWNADIVRRLLDVIPAGWQVPPARPAGVEGERVRLATEQDVLRNKKGGLSIKVGDKIAPAGLYASDHDMFAFMVNEDNLVNDGAGHGLGRGFFMWNSEVGASSFGLMTFLYDAICGNHIVWGAKEVGEIKIRHIGTADNKAFSSIRVEMIKYANDSVSDLEAKIKKARSIELGATKDEAIDNLFAKLGRAKVALSRTDLREAYDTAEKVGRYGSPRSVWGFVNGLTENSQKLPYADARVVMDRAAGKLMEIEF